MNNHSWRNEFHVSRAIRERCAFDEVLFASSGHAVLARPAAAHRFAAALDAGMGRPRRTSPADLFALGLLDEAEHLVIAHWRARNDPDGFRDALEHLETVLGPVAVERMLLAFANDFPTAAVHRGRQRAEGWLAGAVDARSNREQALEELLLLSLANANPAARPYRELFDDAGLARETAYAAALRELDAFFALRPKVANTGLTLLELLRAPVRAAPASLDGQLANARAAWGFAIGDLLERMQLAFDLRRDEAMWLAARGAHGGEEASAPDYAGSEHEEERFSADWDWMPRTVMIAKSTLVWLEQLARRYACEVRRLDQVPDAELDRLAAFGINALWLIGVWERSPSSRRIKQIAGNPDAAASAYAIHDYVIAHELGGEDAWRGLRDRAGARGIRLASDMVPNHMGLDSPWVVEHPDWFLSRPDPPYPGYAFEGAELSSDGRVSLKIEDHYWDRSDAAVVFRRQDRTSGETRYIYHGNDGTSFPWNDTAQLDYLNAAAREAVIGAILGVARRFPIIRFDAAMVLAKKHIQRLWFPEPGSGGGIPSRAGLGLTRAQFDRLMPREFWREVVDRVATESPGTLLLAEAFWLMEGYFVRTLGMHRVYNSAFMVMLRDERNAEYRSAIRNTLEFDPDILQRWVNFVNNPDERTAVDQFGRGEKYFGVCTLMATLPGLPMFGHGQIEGFEERYGMEFRRAMRDEPVDEGLEREHWRRIVPLLHRRSLFAGASEFLLYDCRDHSGHVNEDVFAYSNRDGSGAALVLYHNRYAEARGTIRWSAAYAEKRSDGARALRQRTLLEGLGFGHAADDALLRCRDAVTGHELLLRAGALREHGMRVELGAYGSHVWLGWHEVARDGRPWDELAHSLPPEGVPDLERALWALAVRPAQHSLEAALAARAPGAAAARAALLAGFDALVAEAERRLTWRAESAWAARARLEARIEALHALTGAGPGDGERGGAGSEGVGFPAERAATEAWLLLEGAGAAFAPSEPRAKRPSAAGPADEKGIPATTPASSHAPHGHPGRPAGGPVRSALRLYDELSLREAIARAARAHGAEVEHSWRLAARVRALLAHPHAVSRSAGARSWQALLDDDDARYALGLGDDASVARAPAWLWLPSRLEESVPDRG
jgi:glycosidase